MGTNVWPLLNFVSIFLHNFPLAATVETFYSYLDACFQEGRVVVLVEVHHRQPVGLVPLHLEAWTLKGALKGALIQEEERGGNQEVACLHRKLHFQVSMSYSIST